MSLELQSKTRETTTTTKHKKENYEFVLSVLVQNNSWDEKRCRNEQNVTTGSTEPTHKEVNQRSKYATQVQQRPESPTVTLTWHVCKYKVHKLHQRYNARSTILRVSERKGWEGGQGLRGGGGGEKGFYCLSNMFADKGTCPVQITDERSWPAHEAGDDSQM